MIELTKQHLTNMPTITTLIKQNTKDPPLAHLHFRRTLGVGEWYATEFGKISGDTNDFFNSPLDKDFLIDCIVAYPKLIMFYGWHFHKFPEWRYFSYNMLLHGKSELDEEFTPTPISDVMEKHGVLYVF